MGFSASYSQNVRLQTALRIRRMDLHYFLKLDLDPAPDPHYSEKLDPDPH
jgi:hypothetical protein